MIATLFGIGYCPRIPGTVASLTAIPACWHLSALGFGWYAPVAVGLAALAIPICGRAAEDLRDPDPPVIVLDEVVGQMIAFSPLSIACLTDHRSMPFLIAAFVLFRLFDIRKPGWIRAAEKLRGGWGIVLDDALAGLGAAVILAGLAVVIPKLPG